MRVTQDRRTLQCVRAKSLQSCLTLCDPVGSSQPGCSAHEILQARVLEWAAATLLQGSSNRGSNLCLSHLLDWHEGSLPLRLPGKPPQIITHACLFGDQLQGVGNIITKEGRSLSHKAVSVLKISPHFSDYRKDHWRIPSIQFISAVLRIHRVTFSA